MTWIKLYSNIVDSTIWSYDHDVLRVWIYLLIRADANGRVSVTFPAMASQCLVSIDRLRQILEILAAPDPFSRSREHDGRRICVHWEPEFAVEILNYAKYRKRRDAKTSQRVERYWRRKILQSVTTSLNDVKRVTPSIERHNNEEVYLSNNSPGSISDGGDIPISGEDTLTSGEKEKKHISTVERKNSRSGEENYEAEFAAWWGEYPKRAGGNPRRAAYRAYVARRRAGVSAEELLDGVRRYRRYCEVRGIVGTEFVKQAQFWLSPRYEGWAQDWTAEEQWSSLGIPDDRFIDG
ncbi:MAG: hypothetical protein KatS3mg109_1334 [Pirellulaceae bacterium]|nr:MAG: hypothetical protein KatS3mg109_1334 [Pirellulaceae bacterium]